MFAKFPCKHQIRLLVYCFVKHTSLSHLLCLLEQACKLLWLNRKVVNQKTGNTKGGSITVPLTSCLTGLD